MKSRVMVSNMLSQSKEIVALGVVHLNPPLDPATSSQTVVQDYL